MILIDNSSVMIAAIITHLNNPGKMKFPGCEYTTLDFCRHIVLNIIRSINVKFRRKYGDIVICMDDKYYWRKDIFKYYKNNRITSHEKSPLDWNTIYTIVNVLKQELTDNMAYRCIQSPRCEADDVIYVLSKLPGKHIIISGDKDLIQCQNENVKQYSFLQKQYIECDNIDYFKFEHICKGDISDGIPNILSSDNSLIDKIRQGNVTKKRLELWYELKNTGTLFNCLNESEKIGFDRNKLLIDLNYIPQEIQDQILHIFTTTTKNNRNSVKIMNYFMEKKLNLLLDCIDEF